MYFCLSTTNSLPIFFAFLSPEGQTCSGTSYNNHISSRHITFTDEHAKGGEPVAISDTSKLV